MTTCTKEVASTPTEFEATLEKLTKYVINEKMTSFEKLVSQAMNEYGLAGINVVSNKTVYFAELLNSFK